MGSRLWKEQGERSKERVKLEFKGNLGLYLILSLQMKCCKMFIPVHATIMPGTSPST